MQALLYVDLTTGAISEQLGGSQFTFPRLLQGDDVTLALRFAERVDGVPAEVSRTVRGLKASIGRIDARPMSGQFKIKIGTDPGVAGVNVTAAIAHNANATQVQAAIAELSGIASLGAITVESRDGSWLVRFADATSVTTISAFSNSLFPLSFVRTRGYEFDGEFVNEIRLVQAPVAFTDTSARVVPAPPLISHIQNGADDGVNVWNEIQRLYIPPAFRGTYQIKRGFARSAVFSRSDGVDVILEGMTALADEGGEFIVTNPITNTVHIEFAGEMGGTNQDPLIVEVFDAPEGDLTFTLSLNTAEMAALLRTGTAETAELAIEIEAEIEDEDDEDLTYIRTLYRGKVTVARELTWSGLSTAQNVDWLRPPKPTDYIPFTLDQIITGSQHYTTTLGDGEAESFTIDHNLATHAIHVTVRENASDGAVLVLGEDYGVNLDGTNAITIHKLTAGILTAGEWATTITSAGPVSAFQAHTHTIGQIVGLPAALEDFGSRIETLEALIPSGAAEVPTGEAQAEIARWTLPPLFEVYPVGSAVVTPAATIAAINRATLPRLGGLLAAVHDASVEALPTTIPTPAGSHAGRVFENQTGSDIVIPGGIGRRGATVKPGEFAACDGRVWYKVEKYTTGQSSFYPVDFKRELFTLYVNEKQLRLKKSFRLNFALDLAVLGNAKLNVNTNAQWVLVVETGTAPQDTTPGTPGTNLQNIVWNTTTPALEQRIIITPVSCVHTFGLTVSRALVGVTDTITCDRALYGNTEAVASPPASANFAVRARLLRFDTENSISDPRGFIALAGFVGAEGTDAGFAVIS